MTVDDLDVILAAEELPPQHINIVAQLCDSRLFPEFDAGQRFQIKKCKGLQHYPP